MCMGAALARVALLACLWASALGATGAADAHPIDGRWGAPVTRHRTDALIINNMHAPDGLFRASGCAAVAKLCYFLKRAGVRIVERSIMGGMPSKEDVTGAIDALLADPKARLQHALAALLEDPRLAAIPEVATMLQNLRQIHEHVHRTTSLGRIKRNTEDLLSLVRASDRLVLETRIKEVMDAINYSLDDARHYLLFYLGATVRGSGDWALSGGESVRLVDVQLAWECSQAGREDDAKVLAMVLDGSHTGGWCSDALCSTLVVQASVGEDELVGEVGDFTCRWVQSQLSAVPPSTDTAGGPVYHCSDMNMLRGLCPRSARAPPGHSTEREPSTLVLVGRSLAKDPGPAVANPGSRGHPSGCSRACNKYNWAKASGCNHSDNCRYCHMQHDDAPARTSLAKRSRDLEAEMTNGTRLTPAHKHVCERMRDTCLQVVEALLAFKVPRIDDGHGLTTGNVLRLGMELARQVGLKTKSERPVRATTPDEVHYSRHLWVSQPVSEGEFRDVFRWLQAKLRTMLNQIVKLGRFDEDLNTVNVFLRRIEMIPLKVSAMVAQVITYLGENPKEPPLDAASRITRSTPFRMTLASWRGDLESLNDIKRFMEESVATAASTQEGKVLGESPEFDEIAAVVHHLVGPVGRSAGDDDPRRLQAVLGLLQRAFENAEEPSQKHDLRSLRLEFYMHAHVTVQEDGALLDEFKAVISRETFSISELGPYSMTLLGHLNSLYATESQSVLQSASDRAAALQILYGTIWATFRTLDESFESLAVSEGANQLYTATCLRRKQMILNSTTLSEMKDLIEQPLDSSSWQ